MNNVLFNIFEIIIILVVLLTTPYVNAENFKVNVFYPKSEGIDDNLQNSIGSMASPDFDINYMPVDSSIWNDNDALSNYLILQQTETSVDGFFLACKSEGLAVIGNNFKKTFPKIPFVDSFSPALMAANMISFRHVIMTGSESNYNYVYSLIKTLGIEAHVRLGGSTIFRDKFMLKLEPYYLSTPKATTIPDIVNLGISTTGSHNTDMVVTNAEAIVLVGCEGFLELGVASEAQAQLTAEKIPLQVINPIKSSMGLLYSMIRNKVWNSPTSM